MQLDYENDIKIDEQALDIEWLEQPRLIMHYANAAADAKKEMDHKKEQLEVKKAELDKDIRSDFQKYGLEKITETVVQNTITLQTEYQEASQAFIEAKHEYDMARYAVQSIQDRKEALENLVKLHGQQYFAGPSIPRDLTKEWEQRQKQKNSDEKVKVKRTKK